MFYAYYDTASVAPSRIFYLSSNTGSAIKTASNSFDATSETPSGTAQQFDIIAGKIPLIASNQYKLIFNYTNNTDVNQTGTRLLKILVKEYPEGSGT